MSARTQEKHIPLLLSRFRGGQQFETVVTSPEEVLLFGGGSTIPGDALVFTRVCKSLGI